MDVIVLNFYTPGIYGFSKSLDSRFNLDTPIAITLIPWLE